MKIAENLYKGYEKYEDLIPEYIDTVTNNGCAFIIVNWKDAFGVWQLLNQYTVNGNSIAMKKEFSAEAFSDIEFAKEFDCNMMITVFDSGEMICERAYDNEEAYVDDSIYYVAKNADEVSLPLHSTIIPFDVTNSIFENVV